MTTIETFSQALQLSESDRAELAHQLLLSLETECDEPAEVDAAWNAEIESRMDEIAKGNHATRDWRGSIQAVRNELNEGRSQ
jgi:Putative addiction module component